MNSSAHGAVRRPFADVSSQAKPYAVLMRDGIRLATDVYLPERGGPWPVLLSRLPYDKCGDECFMPRIAQWFTERGYAVVVQDVRGKIRSDGPLAPFANEMLDGYDTLDWITGQRWCAGQVGMFGDSYFAWTQWAAAASQHPALRAIAPRVVSADFGDIVARQGVFALEVCALWAFETWVDEALYDYDGQLDWGVRPLADVVPTALGGRRPAFLHDAARGNLDPAARLPVRGDVPALQIGGWWDIVQHGQISTWRKSAQQHRAPQFLVMDATDHGWTYLRAPGEPYVDPRADPAAMRQFLDAYLEPMVPFFDHFLEGHGSYHAPPVRWMLTHDTWHESQTWPPPESTSMVWYLDGGSSGGSLTTTENPVERHAGWLHDPGDPVPSLSHAYHPLIEPADENATAERDDVLVFESAPVREPIDLAGPADVPLRLSSSCSSTHIMARLMDVAPDGTAFRILDGAAYVSGPWPQAVTVELGSTGYRVRPRHRLRLELSSSEFPRYILHPGTESDPWTSQDYRATEQKLILGGAYPARLRCTVLTTCGARL
ncbi:CocE/NonD family hydrolase [Phytoactinopolyspora mesophila]|uniref:CocE/NonD family hydrolase n=1 Tax=Phytoactinopolyspora mesophila TaxID=2650750 RepID=UPI001390804E